MRAHLLGLVGVPLLGLALFAFLWSEERLEDAAAAREQERVTQVVTALADILLAVDIDERVASVDRALHGTVGRAADITGARARRSIIEGQRTLDGQAALVDRLTGRQGAWREASRRLDLVVRASEARSLRGRTPAARGSIFDRLAEAGSAFNQMAENVAALVGRDGAPLVRVRENVAAVHHLQGLLQDIASSAAPDTTASLMVRAVQLQMTSSYELFAIVVRIVSGDWRDAGQLLDLQYSRREHLNAVRALIPRPERRLLDRMTSDAAYVEWATLRTIARLRALGDRSNQFPSFAQIGPSAVILLSDVGAFPRELGRSLRRRAADRAGTARGQARAARLSALGFVVVTILLGTGIGASIRRPLRRLEERARRLSRGELGTTAPVSGLAPREVVLVNHAFDDLAAGLDVVQQQARALAAGDTQAPVLARTAPGALGEALQQSVGTLSDVSERLRASEALSRAIVTTAADAIWTAGRDGCIAFANPAAYAMLGEREVVGRPVAAVLGSEIAGGADVPVAELKNDEVWLRRPDGARVPVLVSTSCAGGEEPVWTVFARDISVLKEYEAKLAHQAFHDELTQLPNRVLLIDRIEHALARARRGDAGSVGLLMVDLDDFKGVNDVLGHAAGDELLVAVADRLRRSLRPGDTAARLGGDEFAVLLEDLSDVTEAEAVARRIVELLGLPLRAGELDLAVAASIGVRISDAGATPSTLLRDADTAMYAAKSAGKGRIATFTPTMHADATRRLVLRNDLGDAIESGQLRLLYQPVIELATREIVSAEALLRWEHPEHGVVSPMEFIPVAEETELIIPIGRWVLREACRTAAAWPVPIAVNVNISGIQLLEDDIVGAVREALAESGLDPARLVVELTESVLLRDVETIARLLGRLKALGVAIAVDDFGTGYCSLAYLKRFPVDHLKIDRAFTEDLTTGDRTLARSIVDLAGVLGLSAVAEGVETAEQAELLTALSCDLAQGFLFSRPLAAADLVALLERGVIAAGLPRARLTA